MAEFFKVGDHVRVRQWSDMAIEFGVEDYDNEIVVKESTVSQGE